MRSKSIYSGQRIFHQPSNVFLRKNSNNIYWRILTINYNMAKMGIFLLKLLWYKIFWNSKHSRESSKDLEPKCSWKYTQKLRYSVNKTSYYLSYLYWIFMRKKTGRRSSLYSKHSLLVRSSLLFIRKCTPAAR